MDAKRRAEIEERLAAVPPIRPAVVTYPGSASVKCITSRTQAADLKAFIAHAPADIRALLADNAALAQELARVRQETLVLARAQAADLVAVTTELAALHALLAGAPELLERGAVFVDALWRKIRRSETLEVASQLRELARRLRALEEEEEG